MNDKQVFVSFIGAIVFGFVGSLLIIPIMVLTRAKDEGDDIGWGLLWLILMIASAVIGFVLTSKWVRKRYGDFQA